MKNYMADKAWVRFAFLVRECGFHLAWTHEPITIEPNEYLVPGLIEGVPFILRCAVAGPGETFEGWELYSTVPKRAEIEDTLIDLARRVKRRDLVQRLTETKKRETADE